MKATVRKTVCLLIVCVLLLCAFGCKNKTASDAIDDYLKYSRKNPYSLAMLIPMEYAYQKVMEDLIKEFEYSVVEEKDNPESEPNMELKSVVVKITGYDIGAYVKVYLETVMTEVMKRQQDGAATMEDLLLQYQEDPVGFEARNAEICLEYFKELMEQCRNDGKTYHTDAEIVAYYNTAEKEWRYNTYTQNGNVDAITDNVITLVQEYMEALQQD